MARAKVKKRGRGKRYDKAEKAKILATAKKEGLTGAQVAKRFGVSTLTFYRWRGPVRKSGRKARTLQRRGHEVDMKDLRARVQAEIQRVLPKIIQQEVVAYFRKVF
jgi:transposase-like protein